jgi:two-component system, OmpR family, sensor histidine kinase KdpD
MPAPSTLKSLQPYLFAVFAGLVAAWIDFAVGVHAVTTIVLLSALVVLACILAYRMHVDVFVFTAALGAGLLGYYLLVPTAEGSPLDVDRVGMLALVLVIGVTYRLQLLDLRTQEARVSDSLREASLLAQAGRGLDLQDRSLGVSRAMIDELAYSSGAAAVAIVSIRPTGEVELGPHSEEFDSSMLDPQAVRDLLGGSTLSRPEGEGEVEAGGSVFVPVVGEDKLLAFIYVGRRSDSRPHAAEDLVFARQVAAILGTVFAGRLASTQAALADGLAETERLKTTLVSSISHEIKTPIAAMMATVTNLLDEEVEIDPLTQHEGLVAIHEGLLTLDSRVRSLLDLSRLRSDTWRTHRRPTDADEIVEFTLACLGKQDRERVSVVTMPGDGTFEAGVEQLARALINLVQNALSYSELESRVRLIVQPHSNSIDFAVEDDGPGIAEDERERVFEEFYRGTASHRSPSGTGLGLPIAAEIARLHGGSVRIEGLQPHGTRIVLTLPRHTLAE